MNGKLISLVYEHPCAIAVDPIEKKPLFHFLPGSSSLSVGTAGCNLHCVFCQNWETSQAAPEKVPSIRVSPGRIVEEAISTKCKSISYTYNEPTINYEFVLETAKLARKNKLRNVMITNGFINQEPLKRLYRYIDAANIDLKSFSDDFYKTYCDARLEPVLKSIKAMHKMGVFVELTNLIIPTLNDGEKEIRELCRWINSVGDIPLHFSRFFPMYKLQTIGPTPEQTLAMAKKIAEEEGLNYVYLGNISINNAENTYCPKCRKILIEREGYQILQNNIKNGSCSCGEKIPGIWA